MNRGRQGARAPEVRIGLLLALLGLAAEDRIGLLVAIQVAQFEVVDRSAATLNSLTA